MKEFSCETKIIMGDGAASMLADENFQRLLVVSDRNEEELQQMYADLGINEVMNLR